MTLPLHLQMEIDIHAGLHQREISEGFAKLRRKLLPDPPSALQDWARNGWSDAMWMRKRDAWLQAQIGPLGFQLANQLQAANFNPYTGFSQPVDLSLFGGVFGRAARW